MTPHTPTPWKVLKKSCDLYQIYRTTETDFNHVCSCNTQQDAAYIVKAVNAYEGLKEAMVYAMAGLLNVPEVGHKYDQQHSDTHMKALLRLQEALATLEHGEG